MKDRLLHTPDGVRDIYGREIDAKLQIESALQKKIREYGYRDIETPTFEYFDIFTEDIDMAPSKEIYKFFDSENNTLALRPDFTPGVCRAASRYFSEEPLPIRLTYLGQTFSNRSDLQGKLKEVTEIGAECMGDPSVFADAEVVGLSYELLKLSGLKDFQIIIGNVDFFNGIVESLALEENDRERIYENIRLKNYFGLLDLTEDLGLTPDTKKVLSSFSDFVGGVEALDEAEKALASSVRNEKSHRALERMRKLYELLHSYGAQENVTMDLGMLSRRNYYTGLIFRAYAFGNGDAVLAGGRYDRLLGHFGRDAAAVGFTVGLDKLLSTLKAQQKDFHPEKDHVIVLYENKQGSYERAVSAALDYRSKGQVAEIMTLEAQEAWNEERLAAAYEQRNGKKPRIVKIP